MRFWRIRRGDEGPSVLTRWDIVDYADSEDVYLSRFRIVDLPWFGVYVHAIRRPDADRHLHDHPWSFLSVILRGAYTEVVPEPGGGRRLRRWRAGTVHYMRAEGAHAIKRLHRQPVWTLIIVGRRRRNWGFWTEDGWVPHERYFAVRQRGRHPSMVGRS